MEEKVYSFIESSDWQLSVFNSREFGFWVAIVAPQHEALAIIEEFHNSTDKSLRAETICLLSAMNLPYYATGKNVKESLLNLGKKLNDTDFEKAVFSNDEEEYYFIDFFDELFELSRENEITKVMYKINFQDEKVEGYKLLKFLAENNKSKSA